RTLGRRDFRRLFPAGSSDLQLAFFPLVLPPGPAAATARDRDMVRRLRALAASADDPKADALARLLDGRAAKTVVFVQSRATVHHLVRHLRGHRLAAVTGERGWFGSGPAGREEVLRAFAPQAQGAPPPARALETDVPVAPGACAAVPSTEPAVVLVVRLGGLVEGVVVTDAGARADPARATRLLEQAAAADPAPFDRAALERGIRRAAPLLRGRLAGLEDARWRAAHRDRLSRRLIPWVLAAGRRAATR